MTPEVRRLQAAVAELAEALRACVEAGYRPSQALQEAGFSVPPMLRAMVDRVGLPGEQASLGETTGGE